MCISLSIRVAAALLLLTLTLHGQSQPSGKQTAQPSEQSNQGSNQNIPPQTPAQPSPQQMLGQNSQQQMTDQGGTPGSHTSSAPDEPKETLSQTSLFLFGSGVAFFIALLAWSDQIRGINQEIRELEKRFMESTGIEKRTFLNIVKSESPDDRGLALLEVVSSGRIKNKDSAELLQIFTTWNKQWSSIESLSIWKYYMTISLTISLFVVGFLSLIVSPSQQNSFFSTQGRIDVSLMIPPALLVASILVIIICIAKRETELRSLLKSVSDMV